MPLDVSEVRKIVERVFAQSDVLDAAQAGTSAGSSDPRRAGATQGTDIELTGMAIDGLRLIRLRSVRHVPIDELGI